MTFPEHAGTHTPYDKLTALPSAVRDKIRLIHYPDTFDLAANGVNSLIIDGHEADAWGDALAQLLRDPELRHSLGGRARKTVTRRWTIEHAADAMLAGFRLGLLGGRTP